MSEPRGLTGHLELVCDLDARGRTRLRHQAFRAPMHLSKPYHEAGVLVVNMVNPTAGLLDGDRLRVEVTVERGARMLLTSPSANRVHTAKLGSAEVQGRIRVAAGGSLDWCPEMLIPQAGARYGQQTTLEIDEGGELLFFESFAPGRTAMGEAFAYDELRWSTDLRVAGRLLARERYTLRPGTPAVAALRRVFGEAYYAGALLVSPALDKQAPCWESLHAQQHEKLWSGVSVLGKNAFAWRTVAADSLTLRRAWLHGRAVIYAALQRPFPALRRGYV